MPLRQDKKATIVHEARGRKKRAKSQRPTHLLRHMTCVCFPAARESSGFSSVYLYPHHVLSRNYIFTIIATRRLTQLFYPALRSSYRSCVTAACALSPRFSFYSLSLPLLPRSVSLSLSLRARLQPSLPSAFHSAISIIALAYYPLPSASALLGSSAARTAVLALLCHCCCRRALLTPSSSLLAFSLSLTTAAHIRPLYLYFSI